MTAPYVPPTFLPDPHNTSATEVNNFATGIAAYVNALQATVDSLVAGVDLSGVVTNGTFNTHVANAAGHPGIARYPSAAGGIALIEKQLLLDGSGLYTDSYSGTLQIVQATYLYNGTAVWTVILHVTITTPGSILLRGSPGAVVRLLVGTS